MFKVIKQDRSLNDTIIIPVVRRDSLEELNEVCQTSKWKFWQGKAPVLVTTPQYLQHTIDTMPRDRQYYHLAILASRKVDEIALHVPSHIRTLNIYRCPHYDEGRGKLLVNGASTFKSIRLDEWQSRPHRHGIFLGRGVGIKVGEMRAGSIWSDTVDSLSMEEKEDIGAYYKQMYAHGRREDSWWKSWKAPIAAILGILSGTAKAISSLQCTSGGVFVDYGFGNSAPRTPVRSTAIASAAGPAVMLGVRFAAAVYFIPWDSLLSWLKGVFERLWGKFVTFWDKLCSWMAEDYDIDTAVASRHSRYSRTSRHSSLRGHARFD